MLLSYMTHLPAPWMTLFGHYHQSADKMALSFFLVSGALFHWCHSWHTWCAHQTSKSFLQPEAVMFTQRKNQYYAANSSSFLAFLRNLNSCNNCVPSSLQRSTSTIPGKPTNQSLCCWEVWSLRHPKMHMMQFHGLMKAECCLLLLFSTQMVIFWCACLHAWMSNNCSPSFTSSKSKHITMKHFFHARQQAALILSKVVESSQVLPNEPDNSASADGGRGSFWLVILLCVLALTRRKPCQLVWIDESSYKSHIQTEKCRLVLHWNMHTYDDRHKDITAETCLG